MTQAIHIIGVVLLLAVFGAVAEGYFRRARSSRAPFGPEYDRNDPSAPIRPEDVSERA
ncbi:hypothetical protein [Chachezhania antarctica]|uniref:hypothetical protein n=1 Tax=Chachezhania antarctica TaxID=2340860 RepID=UPI0013CF0998|nr:hypothetical protein [Chachezhania antarctica]|tara:strand:- start:1898 stop:2071 length:174 start_codon:yes stop_codon:yes gene_type:complete